MNGISKLSDASGATNPASYMGNAVVHQLGKGANQGKHSFNNTGDGDGSGGRDDVKPLRTYISVIFSQLKYLKLHFLMILLTLLKNSL